MLLRLSTSSMAPGVNVSSTRDMIALPATAYSNYAMSLIIAIDTSKSAVVSRPLVLVSQGDWNIALALTSHVRFGNMGYDKFYILSWIYRSNQIIGLTIVEVIFGG